MADDADNPKDTDDTSAGDVEPVDGDVEPVTGDDDAEAVHDVEVVGTPTPGVRGRTHPLIRAAGILLIGLGVLSIALTLPPVLDPDSAQCAIARDLIEDANDDGDDETFNDVEAARNRDVDDIPCAEAVTLADNIRTDEDNADETESVPSTGAIRVLSLVRMAIGIGQAAAGFFLLRTLTRGARTAGIAFAALGILFSILGLISAAAFAFTIWVLAFSPAARQLWPKRLRA